MARRFGRSAAPKLRVGVVQGNLGVLEKGRRRKYNSALLIGADGVIRDVYDKNPLTPFTEHVPFADLLSERFVDASEFVPGAAC